MVKQITESERQQDPLLLAELDMLSHLNHAAFFESQIRGAAPEIVIQPDYPATAAWIAAIHRYGAILIVAARQALAAEAAAPAPQTPLENRSRSRYKKGRSSPVGNVGRRGGHTRALILARSGAGSCPPPFGGRESALDRAFFCARSQSH